MARYTLKIFSLVALLFAFSESNACRCAAYPSLDTQLHKHDIVFVGTVLDTAFDQTTDSIRARFRVDRYIKGEFGPVVTIYVERTSCGIGVVEQSAFLIFTDASGQTNQCDGSISLSSQVHEWLKEVAP